MRGQPILFVSHDEDGDWLFLCAGRHEDGGNDRIALACLKDIVACDQSLNDLVGLCRLGEARRDGVADPWRIHDGMEDVVRENVERYACHVMSVSATNDGWGFAYSIGLSRTYRQPELICFGLSEDVTHWMINEMRDRMADGQTFEDRQRVSGLIEGYECELRKVRLERYPEFFGYALWFYDGDGFDALQIVWPDKARRYPWDKGYGAPIEQQPATW